MTRIRKHQRTANEVSLLLVDALIVVPPSQRRDEGLMSVF